MSKVFCVDFPVFMTAYVRAETAAEAAEILSRIDRGFEFSEGHYVTAELEISGVNYTDDGLPKISLSPGATAYPVRFSEGLQTAPALTAEDFEIAHDFDDKPELTPAQRFVIAVASLISDDETLSISDLDGAPEFFAEIGYVPPSNEDDDENDDGNPFDPESPEGRAWRDGDRSSVSVAADPVAPVVALEVAKAGGSEPKRMIDNDSDGAECWVAKQWPDSALVVYVDEVDVIVTTDNRPGRFTPFSA